MVSIRLTCPLCFTIAPLGSHPPSQHKTHHRVLPFLGSLQRCWRMLVRTEGRGWLPKAKSYLLLNLCHVWEQHTATVRGLKLVMSFCIKLHFKRASRERVQLCCHTTRFLTVAEKYLDYEDCNKVKKKVICCTTCYVNLAWPHNITCDALSRFSQIFRQTTCSSLQSQHCPDWWASPRMH